MSWNKEIHNFTKRLCERSYIPLVEQSDRLNYDLLDEFQYKIVTDLNFIEGYMHNRKNDFVNGIIFTSQGKKGFYKSSCMVTLCYLLTDLYNIKFDRNKYLIAGEDLILEPELLKVVFDEQDFTNKVVGIDEIHKTVPRDLSINTKKIVGARSYASTARKLGLNLVGSTPHKSYIKPEFIREAINWEFKAPKKNVHQKKGLWHVFFLAHDPETKTSQEFYIQDVILDWCSLEDYKFLRGVLRDSIFSPDSLGSYTAKKSELMARHKKKKNLELVKQVFNADYVTSDEIYELLEIFKATELSKQFADQKDLINKVNMLKGAEFDKKEIVEIVKQPEKD